MISEFTQSEDIEKNLDVLDKCHYSRRVKSNFRAYSNKYDFCKFFEVKSDEGSPVRAVVSLFNSTMMIACVRGEKLSDELLEELGMFIRIYSPFTIEIAPEYAHSLCAFAGEDYLLKDRAHFQFVHKSSGNGLEINSEPKLEDVYSILKTGFEEIARAYPIWLCDTSHRVRRGLSRVYLAQNVSTATVQYIEDSVALVGHVATLPEYRGKMYARSLLYSLGDLLAGQGITAVLFARAHRVSYYKEIGFVKIGEDFVIERKK